MNISSIRNKLVTKYMTQRNEELDTGNKYSVCPNHIGKLELILASLLENGASVHSFNPG